MPLLQVENLQVSFRAQNGFLPVVRGVSLELHEGETLAVVGESGSGKSVSSLALMGLLPSKARVEGSFRFQGDSFEPPQGKLRGHGLSMIFQNPMSSLNPVMTVGKQVAEPLLFHQRMSTQEADDKVLELFQEVGLPSTPVFSQRYPHQLSGGMRQRVVIAIALACAPRVLIADEPTTALDVTIQAQILALLKELQAHRKMGVIMVTHDMSVVEAVAHRVAVMYAGQFVEVGPRKEVLARPAHPYTRALLASRPTLNREPVGALTAIPGRPPSPAELDGGCPFHPRCGLAEESCRKGEPALKPWENRAVRCPVVTEGTSVASQG